MQTTLVTRPIHESEIGNRTFFEVRDDPTGPLAEEYNDVLNAKMREGVSNLVRERYITFAVDAPDAGHAVPALARMRSMASGVLTGIRSDLSPLDGAERAGLLRSMLRPAEPPLPVDWSEVAAHRGHHDEGPRGPEPHRLQAAGLRLGLHHGRHVVPGARVPPVREQPVGPVPRRHGRPSDPPRHLDPRARARAEQGHRLRQAAPQLDRQGGRGGPDERRQEGLRLHPAPRRAALHARRGAGTCSSASRTTASACSATAAWR